MCAQAKDEQYTAGVSEIARALPKGSVAAAFCEREDAAREYARALRKAGIALRTLPLCRDVQALNNAEPDADVRMVIAVGGNAAADCAKYVGKRFDLPVFAAVCSPCALRVSDPHCLLFSDGIYRVVPGAAPWDAVLLENVTATGDELPAALGEILSVAAHLFDHEAVLRAAGKTPSVGLREKIFDLLYAALDGAAQRGRNDPSLPSALAQTALSVARLLREENATCLLHGGAACCARAAAMLFVHEQRPLRLFGETSFLFGSVLSHMYRTFAEAPNVFMPPPDNNLRAEKLREFLGWDEKTATLAAAGRLRGTALTAYRLHEYRDELSELAAEVCRLFDEAKRVFRRLYADDGFGLKGVLDASDVRNVVALAPDTFPVCSSALSLMRDLGFLDRYLP